READEPSLLDPLHREDERALMAFVGRDSHRMTMGILQPYMAETAFTRWMIRGSEVPPSWDDAMIEPTRRRRNERPAGRRACLPALTGKSHATCTLRRRERSPPCTRPVACRPSSLPACPRRG